MGLMSEAPRQRRGGGGVRVERWQGVEALRGRGGDVGGVAGKRRRAEWLRLLIQAVFKNVRNLNSGLRLKV